MRSPGACPERGAKPVVQVCVRFEDVVRHGGHVQAVVDEQVIRGVRFGGFAPVSVHGVLACRWHGWMAVLLTLFRRRCCGSRSLG